MIPDVYVDIQLASQPDRSGWAASASDVAEGGMGLVLPPGLREGADVLLSFNLGQKRAFSRVPCKIVRKHQSGVGAVQFERWSDKDRLTLLSFLKDEGG